MNRVVVPEQRIRTVTAIGVLVAVVTAGLVADATMGAPQLAGAAGASGPVLAGASTCAALHTGPTTGATVATIADPSAGVTDPAPWASLSMQSAGTVQRLETPDVTGGVTSVELTGDAADVLATARWEATPVLLSRRLELGEDARVPGAIEGPCPAGAASRWVVPGVATAGGAAAELHLANPSDVPSSLAVTFTTPAGRVEPTRLANIVVPAHGRTTIDLNEFAPEEPDLGVEVTTRTGTVVVEAVQSLEAAVGGIDGHALVVAHTTASTRWTLPWVSAADGESAWVWVTNPGDQPTDVRLVLHTSNGPIVPPATGLTLAPGTTQRLDLRGALADVSRGGITLRSNDGAPVVVSGAVVRASDDPVRGGIAMIEGVPDGGGGRAAVLSAAGDEGHSRFLAVANPGEETAVLDVTVVGADLASPAILADDLAVPAGGWTVLDLAGTLPAEGGFAVLLDVAEGQAVGTLVAESLSGPLDLNATLARPFPGTVQGAAVLLRRDRSLLHPLVTPGPVVPTDAPAPADAPVNQVDPVEPAPPPSDPATSVPATSDAAATEPATAPDAGTPAGDAPSDDASPAG